MGRGFSDYLRQGTLVKSVLLFLIANVVILIGGCGLQLAKNSSIPEVPALEEQSKAFEDRDRSDFMEFVSDKYDDGRSNKNDLRNDLSQVFDQYSQIDLEFYGDRITEKKDGFTVVASWKLRWTCTRSGGDCSDSGDVRLRKGRTTFEYDMENDDLKLISQKGDRIFGSLEPGSS